MSEPVTHAGRAKYYLAKAEAPEAQAAECQDMAMADSFMDVARQWRDLMKRVNER